MAGTIPLSLTQQFDEYGKPLSGGQLYIIQAGTVSTPQDAFQDTALTILLPNPIPLDAAGRVPQFFLDDDPVNIVKVRLQDRYGVTQLAAEEVLIIGPTGGGGGGGGVSVDGTTIYQTGDIKPRYGTGEHPTPAGGTSPGWVRCNGRTIGSATSSPIALERAHNDCQALFILLYADTTLTVSGGRTGNASNDWNTGKTITTPDFRGRVLGALADMGNTATSILNTTYYGTAPTTLGAAGGVQSSSALIAHTHANTLAEPAGTPPGHFHTLGNTVSVATGVDANVIGVAGTGNNTGKSFAGVVITNASSGTGTAYSIVQPTKLVTFYIKL